MKNCSKYEDNLNLIGPILKEKRLEKGLSLEKLSAELLLLGINIPVTSLHRIENNQRTVRDYEICAFAVVLGINVTDLLDPITKRFKVSWKKHTIYFTYTVCFY